MIAYDSSESITYLISHEMLNLICDPKNIKLKLIKIPSSEAELRVQELNFATSRP